MSTSDVLHDLTLADVLRGHRATRPGSIGAVCGSERLDFAQLDTRVNRLANALAAEGVTEGDRLLWLGQNCHRLLEGLLAAAKIGAAFCPANWRQSAAEFAFVIGDCDPAVVFWQEAEIGDALREARRDTDSKALWLQHDADVAARCAAAIRDRLGIRADIEVLGRDTIPRSGYKAARVVDD